MTKRKPMSKRAVERRGRWLERGLYLIAIAALAVYGVQWVRWKLGGSIVPRGKIAAELQPGDRIAMTPAAAAGANVLVITMDTTRADHLGCYGNTNVRTPVIDELARDGVLFANAFTASPSTLPGHSSIFTGLYPYKHGARANGTYRLAPENTTLAEILKAEGYATGGFISAYVLDGRFGLDQGFDVYHDDLSKGFKHGEHAFRERPAEFTNESAVQWLETVEDQPFFAWVHYFDPHAPYFPPEPFRSQYAGNGYDGEIAYVDQQIGALLAALDRLGKLDDTLIVLASDHGEGLGEHGEATHSLLVYDSTLKTPLIVRPPMSRAMPLGTVVHRQVSNVDIAPTVLDLLGIESGIPFDGSSLVGGPETHGESIYAETIATLVLHGWSPLFTVRTEDAKYIHAPQPELYDVRDDPGELDNLLRDRPETVAALSRTLQEHIGDDLFGADALAQRIEMDEETARALGALGYVGTTDLDAIDPDQAMLRDPKDMVPHFERVQAAEHAKAMGLFAEAVEELEDCLELVPEDVWAIRLLASAYFEQGRLDESETLARRVLDLEKNEPGVHLLLGRIEQVRMHPNEAERHYRTALELDPDFAQAYVMLGVLYARTSGPDRALAAFQQAIDMDPGTTGPAAYCAIGQMHLARLELDQAREAFGSALSIDPASGPAHSGLAALLLEEGKPEEAQAELDKAVRFLPNDTLVLSNRAGLHNKKREFEQAIGLSRRALAINVRHPPSLNALGSALHGTGDLAGAKEAFEKILERVPNYVAAVVNLAQVYLAEGREEKAAELYERALTINPDQSVALFNLGTYKVSRGRTDEAIDLYRRAVAVEPEYAMAHRHLGLLLLAQDQQEQALQHLEGSLDLEPNQPDRERLVEMIGLLKAQHAGTASDPPAPPAPGTD